MKVLIIKRYLLIIIIAMSMIIGLFSGGCTGSASQEEQLKTTTLQIQAAVQTELNSLDSDLSITASKLSKIGLNGSEVKQILNDLCSKYSFTIECCTADAAGKMVVVAPEAYSRYEGTDISLTDAAVKFNKTKEPMLSQVFLAVEGIDAVVLIWPILNEKNDFIGSLNALFKPGTFFDMLAKPILKGTTIELNVMQVDGLNIYDSKGTDAGKNLLTDPTFQPYKELVDLGAKIVAQESGSGNYIYIDRTTGESVKKHAFWLSVKLNNTSWRLTSVQKVIE
ncbi:MAG: cache domain-containing protein [Dehalococcoidales bacterium]